MFKNSVKKVANAQTIMLLRCLFGYYYHNDVESFSVKFINKILNIIGFTFMFCYIVYTISADMSSSSKFTSIVLNLQYMIALCTSHLTKEREFWSFLRKLRTNDLCTDDFPIISMLFFCLFFIWNVFSVAFTINYYYLYAKSIKELIYSVGSVYFLFMSLKVNNLTRFMMMELMLRQTIILRIFLVRTMNTNIDTKAKVFVNLDKFSKSYCLLIDCMHSFSTPSKATVSHISNYACFPDGETYKQSER